MILGIIARDLGRMEEALQSLQRSLHSAKEGGDIAQAGKISARDLQNYLGEAATGNRWPPLVGSASPDDALCGASPHGTAP